MKSTLNLFLLMGGRGTRLQDFSGEKKPMININGKRLYQLGIDLLLDRFDFDVNLNFVIKKEDAFVETIERDYPGANIIIMNELSRGPLETLYMGVENLKNGDFLSLDCDLTVFSSNLQEHIIQKKYPALVTFESDSKSYSYVRSEDGYAVRVAEKEVISNQAIAGAYYFNDVQEFKYYAAKIIEKNMMVQNEFYISQVLDEMIADGKKVCVFSSEIFATYGTVSELKSYLKLK